MPVLASAAAERGGEVHGRAAARRQVERGLDVLEVLEHQRDRALGAPACLGQSTHICPACFMRPA